MVKRRVVAFSLYDEQVEKLEKLADMSGMSQSELIRAAVDKIASDHVELTILMQNFLKKEANKISKERLLRIMSIRKTIKKDAETTQRIYASWAVSLNTHQNNSDYERYGLGRIDPKKFSPTLPGGDPGEQRRAKDDL